MSAIEWQREQRRILLPVIILAPFPITDLSGEDASALLDTGSMISGVSSRVADALGLPRTGKRPLVSAQGAGQVERVAFRVAVRPDADHNDAPAFPFVFDEVIGMEMTNAFEFDALIGMDILRHCDFEMRRDRVCRLRFGA